MAKLSRFGDWGILLACNFIWGIQFVFLKTVQREMGPLFAAWLPLALTSIVLMLIVRIQDRGKGSVGRPEKMSVHDRFAFVLLGVIGKGISMAFGTWAVRLTLASDAALVNLALPICTAVMAFLILGERMTLLRAISFVMAIVGVLLCSGANLHGFDFSGRTILIGNALCFLAVTASAFGNTYSKSMLDRFSVIRIVMYTDGVGALFLFPLTLYLEPESFRHFVHFSVLGWSGLLFLTFMRNLVAVMLFLDVLKRLDATVAGLSHYLMPFFGILTSAIFLGERFTKYMLVGGLVVLCSTLMTTLSERKYKREEQARLAAIVENNAPRSI
jgi:drug/metabolite transporter (DMT)-like permease